MTFEIYTYIAQKFTIVNCELNLIFGIDIFIWIVSWLISTEPFVIRKVYSVVGGMQEGEIAFYIK